MICHTISVDAEKSKIDKVDAAPFGTIRIPEFG